MNPMWEILNKEVDLTEPISFVDHVYLGCTQRECKNKQILWQLQCMFESRMSTGGIEYFHYSQKSEANISSWSNDMEGHAKKCVERFCELANRTTQQLCKVSTPCIDDHHVKEEEMVSVGELWKVCSQIVLKCMYLALIGRPDILWSVNKLARSITNWTKACDKHLARLISYIHHTCEHRQYCHVGHTAQQCSEFQSYFKTLILQETLKTQCQHQGESYVHVRKPNICTNKLDVQDQTNLSFTLFHGSWSNFSRCRLTHGWDSRSRSLEFGERSVPLFLSKPNQQNQRCKRVIMKLVDKHSFKHAGTISHHAR